MDNAPDELSAAELAAQDVQALPDREAMSTLSPDITGGFDNFAMPINEALAINNHSTESIAAADADQTVIIGQVSTDDEPMMHIPEDGV
jgi:hypothetical protein